jgi:hypothetical protein
MQTCNTHIYYYYYDIYISFNNIVDAIVVVVVY